MSEWWTYTVADFLLFSPATYHRLFELHNRALWPAQVLTLALGLLLLAGVLRWPAWYPRAAAAILAGCWAWVAWAYHLERYATINWAATWFAAAFALQALLVAGTAAVRGGLPADGPRWARRTGATMLAVALGVMPAMAALSGRPWAQAEVFGIAPDPTAIGTIGVLLAASPRRAWPLLVIPVLWCVVSGSLLWAMQSAGAAFCFAALAAVGAWTLASLPRRSP